MWAPNRCQHSLLVSRCSTRRWSLSRRRLSVLLYYSSPQCCRYTSSRFAVAVTDQLRRRQRPIASVNGCRSTVRCIIGKWSVCGVLIRFFTPPRKLWNTRQAFIYLLICNFASKITQIVWLVFSKNVRLGPTWRLFDFNGHPDQIWIKDRMERFFAIDT